MRIEINSNSPVLLELYKIIESGSSQNHRTSFFLAIDVPQTDSFDLNLDRMIVLRVWR